MQIVQTRQFKKTFKTIIKNPFIGQQKKGDLDFLWVYKFHMNNQLTLLAYSYEVQSITLTLLALGSHENFYLDIKNSLWSKN